VSQGKKNFYAVFRGRVPGIYSRWFGHGGAQEQIEGFNGALYRGFVTIEEAREFMVHPHYSQTRKQSDHEEHDTQGGEREETGPTIRIYTDGGCIDNPGPGGYGVVIIKDGKRVELSGGYRLTTNNRMELIACIQALRSLKKRSHTILFTDSQYVANAVQKGWAVKWRARHWMRDKTHKAINSDLWAELLGLLEKHDVVFRWVRGHAGNPENERCDMLAKKAAQGMNLQPDPGYEHAMKEQRESRLF